MRRHLGLLRYAIAVLALLLAFAFSIRFSERGFVLETTTEGPLATASSPQGEYDLQGLKLLSRVALQISTAYVEPERVNPKKMLVAALDRVQNAVPEVVATFSPDMDDNPTSVEIRVGTESKTFDIREIGSAWEVPMHLREIFRFIEPHFDKQETKPRDVEYAAINGMLDTLDPHSVLLDPESYSDMQASNRGTFGGLGIVISIRHGELTVISPMPNTPAGRAGFKSGDRIVKINDESTINMPLDEAVGMLRGPPDTTVTVEVVRTGWSEPHKYTLTREVINVDSVTSKALGDGIGYVEIRNFTRNTARDMRDEIRGMTREMGSMKGLILDLRNNPGGLLNEAEQMADAFLEEGTIVTTVGEADKVRDEERANRADTEPMYPIVVLINPGSASASEVVAGALKNNRRALIVGERSFGKGSVQNIFDMYDGSALKLTIAQYLTPGDVSIQGVGIVPDVQFVPVVITDELVDLYPSDQIVREGDLETHLSSAHTPQQAERPAATIKYYTEPEERDPDAIEDPDAFKMDVEIGIARDILKAAGTTWERSELLAKAQSAIERTATEQGRNIAERLSKVGVDWSAADNVIQPVKLEVTTNRRNNQVNVGDKMEITVTATNQGSRALRRVRAVSESAYDLFTDKELIFGRLEPGASRSWKVTVEVPKEDVTRVDEVRFKAFADSIDLNSTTSCFVRVTGHARPHFAFSYWIDDSATGNGDGMLQVGESVKFKLSLRNTGAGDAEKTQLNIRNKSEAALFITAGRRELASLPHNTGADAEFEFTVRSRPESGTVSLDVEAFDTVYREFLKETLSLPVGESGEATPTQEAHGSLVVSSHKAPIYAGAHIASPLLAEAEKDAVLPVSRRREGWYFVTWNGGAGWVPEAAAQYREAAASASGTVTPRIQFQAPFIDLASNEVTTDDATYTVRGVVSDDNQVKDYFVLVQNQTSPLNFKTVKRSYRFLGVPSSPAEATVPLRPGFNRITVVARDNDKAVTSEVMYIYRTPTAADAH